VRVVAWDKLGAICHQFLHKGSRVYLEGRLHPRSWQDPSGQDHAQTAVVASEMVLLDSHAATAEPVVDSAEDDEPPF